MSTIAAPVAPRRPVGWRWGIRLVVAIVALNLVALGLGRLLRSPGGPTSSSYATAGHGLAAYDELLTRSGHPVSRLRTRFANARLDPRATVVMLDPDAVLPADAAALRRFVTGGGVLVAGGADPAWLRRLLPDPPQWSASGAAITGPLGRAPETAGVRSVSSAGDGSWSDPHGSRALIGGPSGALLVSAPLGRGRMELLADASPLQNRMLAEADNPVLGLNLAGGRGRPVVFAENVHGYGVKRGLSALPRRWGWALAMLGLAALVWIAARARRFGPPEDEARALPPPRREYVEAIAGALARSGDVARAAAPVRAEARRRLLRRAALPDGADSHVVTEAGLRLGLTRDELHALLDDANRDERALLAAGSALAKLSEGGA